MFHPNLFRVMPLTCNPGYNHAPRFRLQRRRGPPEGLERTEGRATPVGCDPFARRAGEGSRTPNLLIKNEEAPGPLSKFRAVCVQFVLAGQFGWIVTRLHFEHCPRPLLEK